MCLHFFTLLLFLAGFCSYYIFFPSFLNCLQLLTIVCNNYFPCFYRILFQLCCCQYATFTCVIIHIHNQYNCQHVITAGIRYHLIYLSSQCSHQFRPATTNVYFKLSVCVCHAIVCFQLPGSCVSVNFVHLVTHTCFSFVNKALVTAHSSLLINIISPMYSTCLPVLCDTCIS